MSNIAGIYWDDTAAAPGIALSVYFAGCPLHCPGCHNPEAQSFSYGEPFTDDTIKEIIKKLHKNGVMRNLSILGGEPLCKENVPSVDKLISECKKVYPDLVVYIWSGYTFAELKTRWEDEPLIYHILHECNTLIDGRYEQEKRDTTLYLRGSSN